MQPADFYDSEISVGLWLQPRFEKLHKTTEPKPACPECGSWETKKEFSTFSSVGPSTSGTGCNPGG